MASLKAKNIQVSSSGEESVDEADEEAIQESVAEAVEELVKEAVEQSTKKGLGDLQTNRSKHFVSVIPTIDILVVVF